jgi:phosphate transport system permease protein
MKEQIIRGVLLLMALFAVLALALITFFIFQSGLPLINKVGLSGFLFNMRWDPTAKTPSFGILPMLVGSVWLTLGSLVIGVPLGLAITVFMVDLAPPKLAAIIFTAGTALNLPTSVFSPVRTMAVHFYILAVEGISLEKAYATGAVLIITILLINVGANALIMRAVRGRRASV